MFVPKRRRQLDGQVRRQLGAIFPALARQKEGQIVEGHVLPDHVHRCIALPPKPAAAGVLAQVAHEFVNRRGGGGGGRAQARHAPDHALDFARDLAQGPNTSSSLWI